MTPMTFPEMWEQIRSHFVESLGADPEDAGPRAFLAVSKLVNEDYVEWWGMSEYGFPVYVPRLPQPIRVVLYERGL